MNNTYLASLKEANYSIRKNKIVFLHDKNEVLPFQVNDSATLDVVVVGKPKIEVFPLTLTLIKNDRVS